MKRLEPDERKLSSPVLRGGNGGNVVSLPDVVATEFYKLSKKEGFLHIVLSAKDRKATIKVDDGNDHILSEKPIEFSDMQEGDWRFYLTDNVLLLPREY